MFKQFQRNVYSQNGEDGIIEVIFKTLEITTNNDRWGVDFGAWDGKHLSNVFAWVERGWNAVMIEGDPEKYKDLLETVKQYPKIVPIQAYVGQYDTDEKSLFNLLKTTPIPQDFDLLSIDVDSYDSDIWETFYYYTPKVVIIEINSNFSPGIKFRHIDPPPGEISRGTSFSEMLDVAKKKGYTLVCHTGNCIFVRNDLVPKLGMPQLLIDNPNFLFWGP